MGPGLHRRERRQVEATTVEVTWLTLPGGSGPAEGPAGLAESGGAKPASTGERGRNGLEAGGEDADAPSQAETSRNPTSGLKAWQDLNALAGKIGVGAFRLKTALKAQMVHEDNLMNTPDQEKADRIQSVSPSIRLEYGRRHTFSLDLRSETKQHAVHGFQDGTSRTGGAELALHPQVASLVLKIGRNVTRDPTQEERQVIQWHDDDDLSLELKRKTASEKLGLGAKAARHSVLYRSGDGALDNQDDRLEGRVDYTLQPKLDLRFETTFRSKVFMHLPEATRADFSLLDGRLGLDWQARDKLGLELMSGRDRVDFRNAASSKGVPFEDRSQWTVAASLRLSPREWARSKITWKDRTEDRETGANLELERPFTSSISGSCDFSARRTFHKKMDKPARTDKIVDLKPRVKMTLSRIFETSFAYAYSDTESDDPSRCERHNRFTWELDAKL